MLALQNSVMLLFIEMYRERRTLGTCLPSAPSAPSVLHRVDTLVYLKDVCDTLGNLVACHPPAAAYLLASHSLQHHPHASEEARSSSKGQGKKESPSGGGELLGAFAAIHDRALPKVRLACANE